MSKSENSSETAHSPVRMIAFYLPQYHPIPENDAWWGKGFTEWTNVASAQPLFRGHEPPLMPADLGFYDLRVPEVRQAQAELAQAYGIEGFCYWHYWFGGRRLLERPFDEVLACGEPDFPFCLAWANVSWTGTWYDAPDRILIEQTYPGEADHIAHFNALLPAFRDPRYLRVEGKPLFVVYQPSDLSAETVSLWRRLAAEAGLPGLFLVGIIKNTAEGEKITRSGFDACTISRTSGRGTRLPALQRALVRLYGLRRAEMYYRRHFRKPFHIYEYRDIVPFIDVEPGLDLAFYPCVMPGWDNTPRAGLHGHVFQNPSPEIFREHLQQALVRTGQNPPGQKIVFIKSWNEWAEGNILEPDQRFGHAFLEAVQDALDEVRNHA